MTDTNKIGDAALAQRVIEAYADGLDALTNKECADLGLGGSYCDVLQQVLGPGPDGGVDIEDEAKLRRAGFSSEFILELAADDGQRALKKRIEWLADRSVSRLRRLVWWWWGEGQMSRDRAKAIDELQTMKQKAADAVPDLLDAAEDGERFVRKRAVAALGVIAPDRADAFDAIVKALGDKNEDVVQSAAEALKTMGKRAAPAVEPLSHVAGSNFANETRAAAFGALMNIGRPALPALMRLCESSFWYVRADAAIRIGEIGADAADAIDSLVHMLPDEKGQTEPRDDRVFKHTMAALHKIGEPAVPALIKALGDKREAVRVRAADVIGKIGPKARVAVPDLIKLLADEFDVVQNWAINSLGKIGPASAPAIPHIIKFLDDGDSSRRSYAAEALGGIGPGAAAAVPRLMKSLHDEHRRVQEWAAMSLGKIGPGAVAATDALINAAFGPGDAPRGDAWDALAKIGPGAVPMLCAKFNTMGAWYEKDRPDYVRMIRLLGAIGPASAPAVERLVGNLDSNIEEIRKAAINALGKIGSPAVAALCAVITDTGKTNGHRIMAMQALGQAGKVAHHAIPFLEEIAASHADWNMRQAAAEAIEKILEHVK